MFSSNQQLNYQFLLITHIVCADQQIHSEEAQALRDLAQAANIEENTLLEMEKILSQEDKYLSLELIAGKIPHGQQTETMRQLLTMAHIDGYFAPLEREMIYKIGQVWHWSKNEIDKIIQEAKSKQTQKNYKNNEDEELSLAAKFLENEYKSGLSRAIINLVVKISPDAIKETVSKLEREILIKGPEYDKAIEHCSKIAKEDYDFAFNALAQVDKALKTLARNLENTIKQIENRTNSKGQANTAKEVAQQLDYSRKALREDIIKELLLVRESLYSKQRALNHFSIAFMGRTKAGKSTLHAIITREGWDAIGVGTQRTTRLNRVYEWKNIRIIDTPGIGAPGGKSDEEIAKSIVDESDVICYVVTNDSIQETEFQFMKLLKEKTKPLIILLNVKHNLRESRRLEHFLKNPNKLFEMEGNSGIGGHFERIHRYAKQQYANDYFSIVPVMLLAAQMNNEPEHQEIKEKLFKASRIQDFLDSIRESLVKYGAIRRSQTLLGSTVGAIDSPYQWVNEQINIYEQLIQTLKNKREEIKRKIKKAEDDTYRSLKLEIDSIFNSAINSIQPFAEQHWKDNQESLNAGWQNKLKEIRFQERIQSAYEDAGKKFNTEVQEVIAEVGTELELMAQLNVGKDFKLKENHKKPFWTNPGFITGVISGVVALLIFLPGGIPVTLPFIATAIGAAIASITSWFKSEDQKRREAVAKISSSLREELNKNKDKVNSDLKKSFTNYCDFATTNIIQYFDELIGGLEAINQNLKTANNQINLANNYLNQAYAKRIIDWSVDKYEQLTEEGIKNTISQVDRQFGRTLTIHTKLELDIRKSQSDIQAILQEDIVIKFPVNN
ncbi:GTPase [Sphaerospermopsis sp. LEGE 08334]|uniref:GTPase n=1 Tax=Sphaerospermopsis sp. LEGE 08334 TaxID=1828651 RepID=UPI00187FD709|nr:GTPase [Sphaerospermopsis sp. LEGE 08334]MBE9058654.1 50S ribosome-binding GTPase [Sphaerospermopsis sp. LEGE 08334]